MNEHTDSRWVGIKDGRLQPVTDPENIAYLDRQHGCLEKVFHDVREEVSRRAALMNLPELDEDSLKLLKLAANLAFLAGIDFAVESSRMGFSIVESRKPGEAGK